MYIKSIILYIFQKNNSTNKINSKYQIEAKMEKFFPQKMILEITCL